jgi:hypothetical protein
MPHVTCALSLSTVPNATSFTLTFLEHNYEGLRVLLSVSAHSDNLRHPSSAITPFTHQALLFGTLDRTCCPCDIRVLWPCACRCAVTLLSLDNCCREWLEWTSHGIVTLLSVDNCCKKWLDWISHGIVTLLSLDNGCRKWFDWTSHGTVTLLSLDNGCRKWFDWTSHGIVTLLSLDNCCRKWLD